MNTLKSFSFQNLKPWDWQNNISSYFCCFVELLVLPFIIRNLETTQIMAHRLTHLYAGIKGEPICLKKGM